MIKIYVSLFLRHIYFLFYFLFFMLFFACQAQAAPTRTLSLNDAILLAVRESPNVQTSQLSHIQSKYSLELAEYQFKPHYSFKVSKTTSQYYSVTDEGEVTNNTTGANAGVSLNTGLGTNISLESTNSVGKTFNPGLTLTVIQPLMKGFGRPIVEAALYNAMDSEKISQLQVQETLRNTITTVINAYLDVISAIKTLEVDESALKRSEESVKQTKLFIQAGNKAGVELVNVEADVANSQTRIESDKNNLQQRRYQLLQTIGLDPNENITFSDIDVPTLIHKYTIPVLVETKKLVIENDAGYQAAEITLHGSTLRGLRSAEDNTRWQLNLTATGNVGNSSGAGPNAGLNSLVNGVNQNDSLRLDLTIPIDDQSAKIALAQQKIALRQAEIGLKQQKWSEETKAINGWNSIFSAERALHLSEHALVLQEKAYHVSTQQYDYGLINSLELQTARQRYQENQQNFVNAQIGYLKSLVDLDQLIGRTLKTWAIQVKYD